MNVIITGASSGIGKAAVLRFAQEKDTHILALARSGDKLDELKAEAERLPGKVTVMEYDLRNAGDGSFFRNCTNLKLEYIDILINNAGYLVNKPFEQLTRKDWEEVYQTNVIGLSMLISEVLPLMGKHDPSHIVNISSMGGVINTSKFSGLSAYSSSKGAVSVLSECLAEEFKEKNIRVNALALGSVQTEMLAKAFPGFAAPVTPQEFSEYLFWFSVHGWRFINGKVIPVGGLSV